MGGWGLLTRLGSALAKTSSTLPALSNLWVGVKPPTCGSQLAGDEGCEDYKESSCCNGSQASCEALLRACAQVLKSNDHFLRRFHGMDKCMGR